MSALIEFDAVCKYYQMGTIKSLREKIGTKGDETEFYCYDLKAGCDISEIIKTSGTTFQQ